MKKSVLVIFAFSLLGFTNAKAQAGDLFITPARVIFDNSSRSEELTLANIGKDTATYSISFLQYNMTEAGGFVLASKSDTGTMYADPFLRVFPRKVTIPPNESQVVRLEFHKKSGIKDGEYRSHLYFRSEHNYDPRGEEKLADTTKMAVKLIPIYGVSIPIIVRSGKLSSTASINDAKIETPVNDSIPVLKMVINRTGNSSVYGNLLVKFEPVGEKPFEIGVMNGVGVYCNINKRNISMKLQKAKGLKMQKGKITVTYTNKEGEKGNVLAEQKIDL
ncbi:MAG: hypothetical protein HXX09_11485 [Bacteroidetes bacterium]|nr:hypothetical protein [Bacteroidota bacterium]